MKSQYRSPDPIHLPGQSDIDDTPLTWRECALAAVMVSLFLSVLILAGAVMVALFLNL